MRLTPRITLAALGFDDIFLRQLLLEVFLLEPEQLAALDWSTFLNSDISGLAELAALDEQKCLHYLRQAKDHYGSGVAASEAQISLWLKEGASLALISPCKIKIKDPRLESLGVFATAEEPCLTERFRALQVYDVVLCYDSDIGRSYSCALTLRAEYKMTAYALLAPSNLLEAL